jgi:orotate phosphoribosyltransferase
VERLRMAGYEVTQIIALVDRHQGGAELYQQEGLAFQTMFSIADLKTRWAELH